MTYISISGNARHGKDTAAHFIKFRLEEKGRSVLIVHYADLLKHICSTYLGWDGKKDETGRNLLQKVGTEVYRRRDPQFWVNFVKDTVERLISAGLAMWDYVIIPDARFENELLGVHVHIERPGYDNGLTEAQRHHASEAPLPLSGAIVLYNDGELLALKNACNKLADDIDALYRCPYSAESMSKTL